MDIIDAVARWQADHSPIVGQRIFVWNSWIDDYDEYEVSHVYSDGRADMFLVDRTFRFDICLFPYQWRTLDEVYEERYGRHPSLPVLTWLIGDSDGGET